MVGASAEIRNEHLLNTSLRDFSLIQLARWGLRQQSDWNLEPEVSVSSSKWVKNLRNFISAEEYHLLGYDAV
jgi:hypothetical protein